MKVKISRAILMALIVSLGIIALLFFASKDATFAVLDTKGEIAHQQRDLILYATLLSIAVIIPVFIMTFVITWRYRADKPRGKYMPNWAHSTIAEVIWWGIPIIIIGVLGVTIWKTSHSLDPYKPIAAEHETMTIQVVALQWKWLFIYPEQGIATVNYVQFPENKPVAFHITADAPMNGFWIPQLGGQVYAMNGMQSKLHLKADGIGIYDGMSSNISGEGFSSMRFKAESVSSTDFTTWITKQQQSREALTKSTYTTLAEPSTEIPVAAFGSVEQDLYTKIIGKYMSQRESYGHGEEAH